MKSLASDILENGLKEPIVLSPDGTTVIDGRNRLTACGVVGVEPRFRRMPRNTTEAQIMQYIISANLKKHNLTVGQRALLGCAYIDILENLGGSSIYGEAREAAGILVGVSGKTIQLAKKVLLNRSDLVPKVRSAEITLNSAYEETMKSLGLRSTPSTIKRRVRPPTGKDKSRAATQARVEWIRHLALNERFDSFAIAKRLGIGDGVVRRIAKRNNIEIPSDAWVLKRKKGDFDVNRVAQVVADDLMAMLTSIDRVQDNAVDLDPNKTQEWAQIFGHTAKKLTRIAKLLNYDPTIKRIDVDYDDDTA